ncbi:ParB-like nuclease domain-containing protein [Enterococcus sp. BWB1-3]|uniref:IbrB-like domain-containing protein n=1 Tax=Enterococcus sp. BWB1-3 TaxID=2787713 RepID=UPI001922C2CC|nr:ParB/RepB/Spo0J family partition protein [Enterococcus sp. BWB1-3]MBL1228119.1 ParB-like nuclease domain-containing protein [Enterococcus sp. BWB1-3]
MSNITFPVMEPKMIPINKVVANDYNPNKVAPPEFDLLVTSIKEDGMTQPIVTYYDQENDIYIVIDGFHRYKACKEVFKLKKVPVVTINKSLSNRMASTVRHNRARGTHQIKSMADLVLSLSQDGWSDESICKHLGMSIEEVIKLKQATGLREAFASHTFSKSWDDFEKKYYSGEKGK